MLDELGIPMLGDNKEVVYYTKDSLRMVNKKFLNTYANTHSHHNEEIIMVIRQTGSELLFNAYLNAYSSYYKEAGPELFFNTYLNIHSCHYGKEAGPELFFNAYLNVHSCHYKKMIGYEQLPQHASDAQGEVNQIQSLSFRGIQGQERSPSPVN